MTKVEEIYNQIKDRLTSREQDFVNMIFKIKDTDTKTYEEFQKKYDLNYEQVRSVARDILSKCQNEITQLQYETHTYIRDNIWIKVGDILEVKLTIPYEPMFEDDDSSYNQCVEYKHNGKVILDFDYNFAEDQIYDDVEEYISNCIESDLHITDYEIVEVNRSADEQTAKIKVKVIE